MAKARTSIPSKTKKDLLDEFRHRCAICGGDSPHVHHIDEDPGNNDPENLLPLCPNCHIRDQHAPTAPIEVEKLKLFRKYKNPTILKTQFHPLFKRTKYLYKIEPDSNTSELGTQSVELIEFISVLKMGEFYSSQISKLIKEPSRMYARSLTGGPDPEFEKQKEENRKSYIEQLKSARETVIELIVELLRYQDWN
jgi:hypothetical protein